MFMAAVLILVLAYRRDGTVQGYNNHLTANHQGYEKNHCHAVQNRIIYEQKISYTRYILLYILWMQGPHPTLAGGMFQPNQFIIRFIECEQ